jgi:hypothetical protein
VLHPVRLLEAYVPGLKDLPAARYVDVGLRIAGSLPAQNRVALLIAIPDDEMLLFLVWQPAEESAMRDATSALHVGAVVQRIVDARLIFPFDDREFRGAMSGTSPARTRRTSTKPGT